MVLYKPLVIFTKYNILNKKGYYPSLLKKVFIYMKGGLIMKHFTKSVTFDVDYLFNTRASQEKKSDKKRRFTNDATFDVEKLFEK